MMRWVREELMRARWVLLHPDFPSRRVRLRAAWHYVVRRHRYEICGQCGRPVGPHTGSWWEASDDLWLAVVGKPSGVLCPPCFTERARAKGIHVHWRAETDGSWYGMVPYFGRMPW